MVTEADIPLADGRTLHAYDTRAARNASSPGVSGQPATLFWRRLAAVQPWGFRPDAIRVPVLIMHGASDKMVPCAHGEWLAARCPAAELRMVADAGHVTVLDTAPQALAWLAGRAHA